MNKFILFLMLILTTNCYADSKISDMTLDAAPTRDNYTVEVDDPTGTPASKKITLGSLADLANINWGSIGGVITAQNWASVTPYLNRGAINWTDVIGVIKPATSFASGQIPVANLATGTPTGSKFIRDDGTLQIPAGGGGTAAGGTNAVQYNSGSSTFAGDETKFAFNGTNVGVNSLTPGQRLDVVGVVRATTFSGSGASLTAIPESALSITDLTTGNVTSTAHGFAPKTPADATRFLNGAATAAFAAVKDSDLSTSDITTNDASTTKHGFTPKYPNDATKYLDGTGSYSIPAGGGGSGTVTSSTVNQIARFSSTGTTVAGSTNMVSDNTNIGVGTVTPTSLLTIGSTGQTNINSSGNIGVGTLTPQDKLVVTSGNMRLNPGATATEEFQFTGRVGVTIPVAYVTPTTNNTAISFDIYPKGTATSFGAAIGNAWEDICSTDINADGTNYECLRLGKLPTGAGLITTAKGGTGVIRSLGLQTNGGNVGIGTTVTPRAFTLDEAAAPTIGFSVSGIEKGFFGASSAAAQFFTGSGIGDLAIKGTGGNVLLGANASAAIPTMVFFAGNPGNVGIGTTLAVSSRLTVMGNSAIASSNGSTYLTTAAPTGGMIIEGNVGIGTLTPGTSLDVSGSIRSVAGAAVGVGACWCTTPPKVLGYCTGALGTCSACNYNGSGC